MPFTPVIYKIRKTIAQERIYFLMFSFIILFNALIIFAEKIPGYKIGVLAQYPRVSASAQEQGKEKLSFSVVSEEKLSQLYEGKKHVVILLNLLVVLIVAVFGLGLFLDVRLLAAGLRRRKVLPQARHLRVRWQISDVFRLAVLFIFLGYIVHTVEFWLVNLLGEQRLTRRFEFLLNTGVLDLALLGFILYFVKVKYRQRLAAIGLKLKNAGRNVFLAILGYIAFLPVLALLMVILLIFSGLFKYQQPGHELFSLFLEEKQAWFLVYATFMVVLLGPLIEEIFFRGFVYNAVKKRFGVQKAMLITAAVFAALHANLIGFFPIFALGILLVYMYEKTGSLVPSITIHILHNGLMVGFLFLGRYLIELLDHLV